MLNKLTLYYGEKRFGKVATPDRGSLNKGSSEIDLMCVWFKLQSNVF